MYTGIKQVMKPIDNPFKSLPKINTMTYCRRTATPVPRIHRKLDRWKLDTHPKQSQKVPYTTHPTISDLN